MYEVEVKVAAEHDAVRGRLPEDADALGTVEQVDTYFDAPHREFAATDEALRLRRERRLDPPTAPTGDGSESTDREWTTAVTYKGPLLEAESKSREEFETVVADGEALESVLERLGFEPAAEVRKERERYRIDEFTVSLDAVEGLGEYLEVETEIAEDAGEAEAETLDGVFAALADGLAATMCDAIPDSGERFTLEVDAESRDALLFDYLDELIYERDVRAVLPVDNEAAVHRDGDRWTVEASARGVPLDEIDAREIKAVTYSDLKLAETVDGWRAYVVFDV